MAQFVFSTTKTIDDKARREVEVLLCMLYSFNLHALERTACVPLVFVNYQQALQKLAEF